MPYQYLILGTGIWARESSESDGVLVGRGFGGMVDALPVRDCVWRGRTLGALAGDWGGEGGHVGGMPSPEYTGLSDHLHVYYILGTTSSRIATGGS
jgi:hypothetical protein